MKKTWKIFCSFVEKNHLKLQKLTANLNENACAADSLFSLAAGFIEMQPLSTKEKQDYFYICFFYSIIEYCNFIAVNWDLNSELRKYSVWGKKQGD